MVWICEGFIHNFLEILFWWVYLSNFSGIRIKCFIELPEKDAKLFRIWKAIKHFWGRGGLLENRGHLPHTISKNTAPKLTQSDIAYAQKYQKRLSRYLTVWDLNVNGQHPLFSITLHSDRRLWAHASTESRRPVVTALVIGNRTHQLITNPLSTHSLFFSKYRIPESDCFILTSKFLNSLTILELFNQPLIPYHITHSLNNFTTMDSFIDSRSLPIHRVFLSTFTDSYHARPLFMST